MAISEMRYTPSPVDVVLYVLPVVVFLTVTDAPLTAAPVLSTTVPAIAPRSDWATTAPDSNRQRKPSVSAEKNGFISPLQSLQNASGLSLSVIAAADCQGTRKCP